jgi:hypothetical protein
MFNADDTFVIRFIEEKQEWRLETPTSRGGSFRSVKQRGFRYYPALDFPKSGGRFTYFLPKNYSIYFRTGQGKQQPRERGEVC